MCSFQNFVHGNDMKIGLPTKITWIVGMVYGLYCFHDDYRLKSYILVSRGTNELLNLFQCVLISVCVSLVSA